MANEDLARAIRAESVRIGFDRVGFCDAALPPETALFERWLEEGMQAGMSWLDRGRRRRLDPRQVLEDVRSIIVVAHAYATPGDPPAPPKDGTLRGQVARYARGEDYHAVTGAMLLRLQEFIEAEAPGHRAIAYVDTGPVIERLWAAKAGIGWVGKNAMILNERMGSWFFLGVVLTTVPLPHDAPVPDRCGACSMCIDACPTGAIVEPRLVDSRLCISYHTIELRGPLPEDHRRSMGPRVFGCDDCQEACPWNGPSGEPEKHAAFPPREGAAFPSLIDLLALSREGYLDRFRGSAIKRATWAGLRRNAAVAIGNAMAADAAPSDADRERARAALEKVASDAREDPMIRDHAAWAARRAAGD